jgi:hypothetical protein
VLLQADKLQLAPLLCQNIHVEQLLCVAMVLKLPLNLKVLLLGVVLLLLLRCRFLLLVLDW